LDSAGCYEKNNQLGLSYWESLSDKVHQMPKDMLVKTQDPVTLTCSHTISNYYTILWYKQVMGDVALNLIGYVRFTEPSTESQYTNLFIIKGDGAKSSTLEFKPNASGSFVTYYCAASEAQC
uniref:Ig-like domain-containing protein n=1 Tax=Sinocyclocheilus rhinocerous TaxID=307959 RepID=A0A673HH75_9TELE